MDGDSQMRYPNLFKMMIKKFVLISDVSVDTTTTTAPGDSNP